MLFIRDTKRRIIFQGLISAAQKAAGKLEYAVFKEKNKKFWINLVSAVTVAVYLVPRSLFGSELDYSKLPSK